MSQNSVYTDTASIEFTRTVGSWAADLEKARRQMRRDRPNYFVDNPANLATSSNVHQFILGNGRDVYSSILPALESAESEIIFVTCFWAKSESLDALSQSLRNISSKAIQRGSSRVRVRLGFSSSSLFQKLFHTSSLRGHIYPPSTWVKKLHLPPPKELKGLDLEIKSIFILPFSVMHPKFAIIDRKKVFVPSCNASWESWFEGCVEVSGPIVNQFTNFWDHLWGSRYQIGRSQIASGLANPVQRVEATDLNLFGPAYSDILVNPDVSVPSLFLPSPHHRNPGLRPFASQSAVSAPATPLNTLVLKLLSTSTSSIYLQSPNVTSPPVLLALITALERGVDVHVVTSEKLMTLEQLVTAGTTTKRCLRKLVKKYEKHRSLHLNAAHEDEEQGLRNPGSLRIEYYQPHQESAPGEPVKSHLKLTIVDGNWVVLGSGNMDRASWFTSQELGVAFFSHDLAKSIEEAVETQLRGRCRSVFDSSTS